MGTMGVDGGVPLARSRHTWPRLPGHTAPAAGNGLRTRPAAKVGGLSSLSHGGCWGASNIASRSGRASGGWARIEGGANLAKPRWQACSHPMARGTGGEGGVPTRGEQDREECRGHKRCWGLPALTPAGGWAAPPQRQRGAALAPARSHRARPRLTHRLRPRPGYQLQTAKARASRATWTPCAG